MNMPKDGRPKSYADGRHSGASQAVLTYLREHANTEIPYPEISKAIGAKHAYTVSNAVGYLISKGLNIQKPMNGVAIFRTGPVAVTESVPQFPRPAPTNNMWEEVGTAGEAGIIVRDEMGNLGLVRAIKEILT